MAEVFSGLSVPKWWRSEAGLWLPSSISDLHVQNQPGTAGARFDALLYAQRPRPLGNVGVYATPSAIGVAPMPFNEFITTLASVPLGMIFPVLCEVQRVLHRRGMDPDVQLALAAGFFSGTPAFEPLARWINSVRGERVAFCEQAVTFLQLLAILVCEEELNDLSGDEYAARIRGSMFFVPQYLGPHATSPDEDGEGWLRHLIQLFDYNGNPVFGNALGRTWTIFGRLHREGSDISPAVPLDDWLRETYGLGLEQQLSLGFALFAHLSAEGEDDDDDFTFHLTHEALGGIFNSLDFSEEERVAAEAMIAAPPPWFREQVQGESLEQLSWNRVPFLRRPFVRLPSGQYFLQSPRALMSWIADGIHYRCLDAARENDALGDYTTRLGKLTERYVVELVASAHQEPRLPGAGKVHGDKKFGNGIDSSDVTVTYPHEVVLMEVASHRLTVETMSRGDQQAMEKDMKEMVGRRPKQLRRSIDSIKPQRRGIAATLRYERLDPTRIARFWPLIITMTPLHWSPLMEQYLAEPLAELDGRGDVETLDVLAVEDLESLIAITDKTGARLADLLAAKQEASGPHADVRTWLSLDRRLPNITRPAYVDDALHEALDTAARLLGFEGIQDEDAA